MEGWVSLHRRIMDHWTFEEKRTFSRFEAWIDLILSANHKDTRFPLGNEIVEAKRGEVITSELKLMDRWGWSKTKLRNFLELAEKDGMIIKKTDRKKTTIYLVNYDDFQNSETTERLHGDHEETTRRPREDTINNVNNAINITATTTYDAMKLFESCGFGTLNDLIRDEILDLINFFSEPWVCEAMRRAVIRGKRNLGYVRGILKDWVASGFDEPWREEKAGEQPRGRNQKVTPLRNPRAGEILFPDDELDELNRASEARLLNMQ